MEGKYIFKDEDITTDILFKIEEIVSILAENENITFDEAYTLFISSNIYGILLQTNNLLWAESAEFITDEYYREKVTQYGRPSLLHSIVSWT
jgi:hypothetical protein